jgi:TnpA family transposase
LPALIALRRLAGTAQSKINAAQWGSVCAHLDDVKQSALEALLVVNPITQRSPFADLCRAPGRASRKNLKALIDRYHWLAELPDPMAALRSIADSKVLQWANEAMRLNALELREYVTPRRQTLLLALIRHARGQVLDDLTQMLLRLARKVEWKSQQRLEQWYAERHAETDSLIRAFHDSLIVHGSEGNPTEKLQRLETLFTARGGRDQLAKDCAEHLRHEKQNWRPFAQAALQPLRSALLRVTSILPLQATATTRDLLADNYIALFSRFIACGTYEATYILDALLQNLSDLHPKRVHADTHGQSVAVFGLAYLLGIELMPRIRRWRKLRLYRAERDSKYRHIDSMFSGTVNWALIRELYPQFMQLALAIQGGALAPSAVLARINSYSTRNRFALALQELGKAVRTTYLLEWIMSDSLQRTVHKGTTKIERHHKFAKHLAFGGDGLFRTNDPADQEKAIVYNELVANAVALQTAVDQTQALHALKSNGIRIDPADLAFLSPYQTSKLKRFGDYPTNLIPEAMPITMSLPV